MDRKIFSSILLGIILISTVVIFVLSQGTSNAEECRMIKIQGQPGGQATLTLEPDTIIVNKGTCVIWVNFARTEEVQVIFEQGKVCEDVTEASVGFKLDAKNCYVTNYIPFGGTSSLLFKEPGEFKYILKAGVESLNGKIIVTASK
jgi:plastocyanin